MMSKTARAGGLRSSTKRSQRTKVGAILSTIWASPRGEAVRCRLTDEVFLPKKLSDAGNPKNPKHP